MLGSFLNHIQYVHTYTHTHLSAENQCWCFEWLPLLHTDKPLHKIVSLRSELGVSISCNARWSQKKTGWMREIIHLKIRGAFYVHRWFDTLKHPGLMRLNSEQVRSVCSPVPTPGLDSGLRFNAWSPNKFVHGALFIANGNLLRFHYSSGLNQD